MRRGIAGSGARRRMGLPVASEIDVECPCPAVFEMGFADLQDGRAKRRLAQPVRNLMAQDAHALGNRAVIGAGFAFAGDDEDQTQGGALSVQDKADQVGMRLGQG